MIESTTTETVWGAWSADAPPNTLPATTFPMWADAQYWASSFYGEKWPDFISLRPVPPDQVTELAARRAAQLAYANAYNAVLSPPAEAEGLNGWKPLSPHSLHVMGLLALTAGAAMAGVAVAHAGLADCCLWTLGMTGVGVGAWWLLPYARHDGKGE